MAGSIDRRTFLARAGTAAAAVTGQKVASWPTLAYVSAETNDELVTSAG